MTMHFLVADTNFAEDTWIQIVKPIVIFAFLLGVTPMVLLLERKLMGRMQSRYGPNRVGPWGLMQPLADVIKLLTKENSTPVTAVPWLMTLAPMISVLTAVYPAVWGVGQLGTGALSDRLGRKGMIACGMWTQAFAIFLIVGLAVAPWAVTPAAAKPLHAAMMMDMSMAADMPCCPDKQVNPDCGDCPLVDFSAQSADCK